MEVVRIQSESNNLDIFTSYPASGVARVKFCILFHLNSRLTQYNIIELKKMGGKLMIYLWNMVLRRTRNVRNVIIVIPIFSGILESE